MVTDKRDKTPPLLHRTPPTPRYPPSGLDGTSYWTRTTFPINASHLIQHTSNTYTYIRSSAYWRQQYHDNMPSSSNLRGVRGINGKIRYVLICRLKHFITDISPDYIHLVSKYYKNQSDTSSDQALALKWCCLRYVWFKVYEKILERKSVCLLLEEHLVRQLIWLDVRQLRVLSHSSRQKQAEGHASYLHAQAKGCGVLTADLDGSLQFQENRLLHENVPRLDAKHLDLPLKQLYLLARTCPCMETERNRRAPDEYDVFRIGRFGEGTPTSSVRFQFPIIEILRNFIKPHERIFRMPRSRTAHR